MKFHWGTGITLFILLFLGTAALFIVFAMRQDIDLVHEDYYERGVEHDEQMEVAKRSEALARFIRAGVEGNHLLLSVYDSLALQMDSATYLLYRPSDARMDQEGEFLPGDNPLAFSLESLNSGRYILIFQWYSQGLRHEVQQTLNIP